MMNDRLHLASCQEGGPWQHRTLGLLLSGCLNYSVNVPSVMDTQLVSGLLCPTTLP